MWKFLADNPLVVVLLFILFIFVFAVLWEIVWRKIPKYNYKLYRWLYKTFGLRLGGYNYDGIKDGKKKP